MLNRETVAQVDTLAGVLMRACETPAVAEREGLCIVTNDAAEALLALLDHLASEGLIPEARCYQA